MSQNKCTHLNITFDKIKYCPGCGEKINYQSDEQLRQQIEEIVDNMYKSSDEFKKSQFSWLSEFFEAFIKLGLKQPNEGTVLVFSKYGEVRLLNKIINAEYENINTLNLEEFIEIHPVITKITGWLYYLDDLNDNESETLERINNNIALMNERGLPELPYNERFQLADKYDELKKIGKYSNKKQKTV